MPRKRCKTEQIVALLWQVEVFVANGRLTPQFYREAGISEQTYYRLRKEYGGLKLDQARRLKDLGTGKRQAQAAELSLEKQILKDVAQRNL